MQNIDEDFGKIFLAAYLKSSIVGVFKVKFFTLITKARNSETTKNTYALLHSNIINLNFSRFYSFVFSC
jgi:hypothetical protein